MSKIVLAGLSAAGKTTHTQILAEELGFQPVHVTELLLSELGVPDSADVWRQRLREVESLRDGGTADDLTDVRLLELCAAPGAMIFDAWALPWYCTDSPIRIWIGSDRLSRTWKCMVSALPASVTAVDSAQLLEEKDGRSRDRFLDRYGFDLYADRSVFDFVLDNSHLIGAPTRAASDDGIAAFAPVISACARAGLAGDLGPVTELLETASPEQAACLVSVGPQVRTWEGYVKLLAPATAPSRTL